MSRFATTSFILGLTAADIADCSGVPFIGPAALLLGELGKTCEQVQIHKTQCKLLLKRVQLVLEVLRDGSPSLHGTKLQQAADELENILTIIVKKMASYANLGLVRSFWKRDDIAKALRRSIDDIETYKDRFHIQADMATTDKLNEMQQIAQCDNEEMRAILHKILATQEETNNLLRMRQEGEPAAAEEVMRAAQTELLTYPNDSLRYKKFGGYILNLHQSTGVMPTIPDLNHEVVRLDGPPLAGGTYSEVSKGIWLGKVEVALKSLREVKASHKGARRRFEREVSIWHTLDHVNVLRFLGVVNIHAHICLVSLWQSNGNILDYTQSNMNANRLLLLVGAARGIEYIHSRVKPVIHGNIKCSNILVSDQEEALISDFGLSRVMEEINEIPAFTTFTSSGGIRWFAPELMSENSSQSTATDVYAFSMSILECLTSEKPFAHLRRDPHVVLSVMDKKRPNRPGGVIWKNWFSEPLWDLLERCWAHEPDTRPDIHVVVSELVTLINSGKCW